MRRRHARTLCCLLLVAVDVPVEAQQPPRFGLNWSRLEGAESCLSAAALGRRVEAHFGHVIFGPVTEAKLFVDGHVRAGTGTWEIALSLSLPAGSRLGGVRHLQLPSVNAPCSVIDEGVVFVIERLLEDLRTERVPLDPELAAELDRIFSKPAPEPAPVVPVMVTAQSHAEARPVRSPVEDARGSAQTAQAQPLGASMPPAGEARVDLAAVSGVGLVPGLSAGFAVHATLDTRAIWPVELTGVFFLPRSFATPAELGPRSAVEISMIAVSAALCPLELFRALALCAGGELGFVNVQRNKFSFSGDTAHLVGGPIAAAVYRLELGSDLHVRLSATVAPTLPRNRYVFDDGETLLESSPITARAELGVGLRL